MACLVAAIQRLSAQLREVEDRLVQVEFTADGDSLNYCEQLFEKLSGLPPVLASATLSALIDGELAELDGHIRELGVAIISA